MQFFMKNCRVRTPLVTVLKHYIQKENLNFSFCGYWHRYAISKSIDLLTFFSVQRRQQKKILSKF